MVLSTAGADGRPRGRHVLLKGLGPDGLRFFDCAMTLSPERTGEASVIRLQTAYRSYSPWLAPTRGQSV